MSWRKVYQLGCLTSASAGPEQTIKLQLVKLAGTYLGSVCGWMGGGEEEM